jgi:biotin synthase
VKKKIDKISVKRICIQCPYCEKGTELVKKIAEDINTKISISVSISAVNIYDMKILKEAGIDRLGIGLDCATEEVFNKWKKGVPSWKDYIQALTNAKKIFGETTCHIMIGLGETDKEALEFIEFLNDKGIKVALFAYFKGKETVVDLPRYRVIQIARYFIEKNKGKFNYEADKLTDLEIPFFSKDAFLTSGCPNCNRPFYNERVTKIYNYPYILSDENAKKALKEAQNYAGIYIASE